MLDGQTTIPPKAHGKSRAASAMLMTCRHCHQWESAPDDIHCSFCGSLLLDLEVSPAELTLISTLAATKDVVLRNTGARPLQVFVAQASGAPFPAITTDPPVALEIEPNGEARVRLLLDGGQLPPSFLQQRIEFVCVVDNDARKRKPLVVNVRSGPRPRLLTPVLDFGNVEEGHTVERTLELENGGGTPLRVSAVEPVNSKRLRLESPFCERVLQPKETLVLAVVCDGVADVDEQGELSGMRIRFANFPETAFAEARVRTYRYRLGITPNPLRFPQALSTREHAHQVRLENHGNTDVEIIAIESDQPWLSVVSRTATFTLLCGSSATTAAQALSPTTFTRSYEFKVVCRPKELKPGKHRGSLIVRPHAQPPVTVSVEIDVVDPRPYNEYIGIDFGTTNSVVAVLNGRTREIELVQDELTHSYLIPSVLVFEDAETWKIGQAARNEADLWPERTVRSIKRIMGYEHEREFFERRFTAGALASLIIRRLKELAERKLHQDSGTHYSIGKAIITVPANFFDLQIREVLDACRDAGLDIEEEHARRAAMAVKEKIGRAVNAGVVLDEPSAAVLYYIDYLRRNRDADAIMQAIGSDRGLRLLVFDHGGGTLDVSLANIAPEGGETGLRILANVGDNAIGGDSIDLILMKDLLKRCADKCADFGFETALIATNFRELQNRSDREGWSAGVWKELLRVRGAWKDLAEAAKLRLAANDTDVDIRPDIIIRVAAGKVQTAPRGAKLQHIKRTALNDLLQPVLKRCTQLIESALDLAHLGPTDVDYILHTGRQSLLPTIRNHVRALFPHLRDDHDVLEEAHLKVCVAKGAALYGSMRGKLVKSAARIHFLDEGRSLPHSYGVETFTNPLEPELDEIIPRGSQYPTEATRHYGPDMIQDSGYLNLRFYQNTGTSRKIVGNPQVSFIGEISIDTIADGKPGCDVQFVIGANRTLEVFADGRPVQIQRGSLQDEEGWMG